MFGESIEDRRDYRMGLAGFLAGFHSLRFHAEHGKVSATELQLAVSGIKAVLDQIPAWNEGEREQLDDLLDNLVRTAALNYGQAQ